MFPSFHQHILHPQGCHHYDILLGLSTVAGCQWSPCTAPHDQRGAMRSTLMKARFHGMAAKMKAFLLPTWKSMRDETTVLQAYARQSSSPYSLSKALCHLSRCPASSFSSIHCHSRASLVRFSNMSIHALPLSIHISLSIHHFLLLCIVSSRTHSLCFFCLSYQMLRVRNVKSVTNTWHKAYLWIIPIY